MKKAPTYSVVCHYRCLCCECCGPCDCPEEVPGTGRWDNIESEEAALEKIRELKDRIFEKRHNVDYTLLDYTLIRVGPRGGETRISCVL